MEYNWNVNAMEVKLSEGEMKDVVTLVHWTRVAVDGEFSASSYGTCPVGEPTPEQFVSYEDLTKEEVESWLEASLDVKSIDAGLVSQIESQKNPVDATLPPPFNN
jgi:hypothetical protein